MDEALNWYPVVPSLHLALNDYLSLPCFVNRQVVASCWLAVTLLRKDSLFTHVFSVKITLVNAPGPAGI